MAQDDHDVLGHGVARGQSGAHQRRADPLALVRRQHGHRPQPHRRERFGWRRAVGRRRAMARLYADRAEKDMTQKVLAEAVGVSRQTINAIEKGEYNPTIKLCRKICRVLDKSLDDLFWEDEEDEN